MKITYNGKEKTIAINDGLKTQYFLFKLMLVINLLNSIIFSISVLKNNRQKWLFFFWIILGIISLILFYKMRKKVSSEKIPISEISSLTEKEVFGRKRFSLKLKNGKYRDLLGLKNKSDITNTKELFRKLGVKLVN